MLSPAEIVAKFTGFNFLGPNCYNAVLMFHGAANTHYTPPETMEKWLNANTSRLGMFEMPKHGDIAIFRSVLKGELLHTAIYIEPNKYWHKPGYGGSRGYEFITYLEIVNFYGMRMHYRRIKEKL